MKSHNLKTWPEYFQAVWDEKKTFEFRLNDRNFEVGDILILEEWEPKGHFYTGRKIQASVTYILSGFGDLIDVILAIKVLTREELE